MKEEEAAREIERESCYLDTSHVPGHTFIPKPLSLFMGTMTQRLYQASCMRFSLFLGLSLEICRLEAVLPAGHPCLPKRHEVCVLVSDTLYVP